MARITNVHEIHTFSVQVNSVADTRCHVSLAHLPITCLLCALQKLIAGCFHGSEVDSPAGKWQLCFQHRPPSACKISQHHLK